jgi:hypothetical protein
MRSLLAATALVLAASAPAFAQQATGAATPSVPAVKAGTETTVKTTETKTDAAKPAAKVETSTKVDGKTVSTTGPAHRAAKVETTTKVDGKQVSSTKTEAAAPAAVAKVEGKTAETKADTTTARK